MLDKEGQLLIARSETGSLAILPRMANRHGLITGATGTGKTITLQVIAESMSALGIPVVITDIKGDVSGIAKPGNGEDAKVIDRVTAMGLAEQGFSPQGSPACFWDIFAKEGHPLRATVSEMGALLIGRILDLNDTQQGVLQLLFRIADDNGLLLLDLKDLRKLAEFVGQNRAQFSVSHGNIASATIGAIQRGLLGLEEQGGDIFFGEPVLDVADLMQQRQDRGVVNILAAEQLMQSPRIYGSFLLWLLSELYEKMPEAGDLDKPKLVLFFDEAHLIFTNAPKALLEKIEQVVRLIRSKAVGIYFITQNPIDVPESVLAQLGNRVQHALRAYTPKEQKAVRAAAASFRPNPAFKTEEVIAELGVGEALVSFLDAKGIPGMVERAKIVPPQSRIGPLAPAERDEEIRKSPLYGRYEETVDRESAYEKLIQRVNETVAKDGQKKKSKDDSIFDSVLGDFAKKTQQSISRNIANQVGRGLVRGVLGGLFGGKK